MVEIKRDAKRPGFVALCSDPALTIFSDQQYSHGLIGFHNWEHSFTMHCFRMGVKMACAFATTNKYKERDESWFVDLHSNLTLHCLRQREITL